MSGWNIFARYYSQKENHWTESLVKFLANSSPAVVNALLSGAGLSSRIRDMRDVNFKTQVSHAISTGRTIPDALIAGAAGGPAVYFEAKVERDFDEGQALRHIRAIARTSPDRERALVLVTGAPGITSQFEGFAKRLGRTDVKVRFLPWYEIAQILGRVGRSQLDSRTKFLVEQYREFVEEEVKSMAPWQGFSKGFSSRWACRLSSWDEAEKLVTLTAEHIEKRLEDRLLWPKASMKGRSHDRNSVYQGWDLWSRYNAWLKPYVGLYGEKRDQKPSVFVSWWWSESATQRLSGKRFSTLKRRMVAGGFEFSDDLNYVEKTLDVGDLQQLPRERQVRRVLSFLDRTIDAFRSSRLESMLK